MSVNGKLKATPIVIVSVSLVVVVVLTALSGFFRVGPGEEGLVITLGRVTDRKAPGLYWHIPVVQTIVTGSMSTIHTMEYGFRTVEQQGHGQVATYQEQPEESVMLTGDGNLVNVEAIFQYQLSDLRDFEFEVEDAVDTMRLSFETVMRRNIQSKKLDDALLKKEAIELEVLPDLQRSLDSYHIGVKVRMVRIQNISVPDEVKSAYEDVNNAKNEKTSKLDEAEKYKNQVVPVARSNAYNLINQAEGYAAEKIAKAEGDAQNFKAIYAEYKSTSKITRDRLLIETLEEILKNAEHKMIMEADGTFKAMQLNNLGDNSSKTGGVE